MSVAGATGNGAAEAYTTSLWGVGLSHVITEIAEAETVATVEGYHVRCRHREAPSLCRGRRPHHAGKDRTGTQEALVHPPVVTAGAGGEGQPEPSA